MTNILDGLGLECSILDGLDDWPKTATSNQWLPITRKLVASTIADMDLEPAAPAEVEEAFTLEKHPRIMFRLRRQRQTQSAVQTDALVAEPHPLLEHQVAVRTPEGLGVI